jgi:hypothetical protein
VSDDSESRPLSDIEALRQLVFGFALSINRRMDGPQPQPGSPAAADAAWVRAAHAIWSPQPWYVLGERMDDLVTQRLFVLVVVMVDSLYAMSRCLGDDDGGMYAPAALGRVAIEAAGTIVWLTEPGLWWKRRMERVMTFELASALDTYRGMRRFYGPTPVLVSHRSDMEAEAHRAELLGLTVHREGNNDPAKPPHRVGVEPLPRWFNLVTLPYPDKPNTGVLRYITGSATVHPSTLGFLSSAENRGPTDEPNRTRILLGADVANAIALAHDITKGCAYAFQQVIAYYGWDAGPFTAWSIGTDQVLHQMHDVAAAEARARAAAEVENTKS